MKRATNLGSGAMKVLTKVKEMTEFRDKIESGKTVGLVATMGSLHEGHASLIRRSVKECDLTIVTIFVNPKQFSEGEDLSSYPRRAEADVRLCERLGACATFMPEADEMYGGGFDTVVTVGAGKSERNAWSEGRVRPRHFEGVATVVTKLLILSRPTVAYFGEKDGQQVAVAKRLIGDLFAGTEMRVCATEREEDGVALSSRNEYLSRAARREASVVYEALKRGSERFASGCRDAGEIRRVARDVLADAQWRLRRNGGASGGGEEEVRMEVEYVSVCERWSMREVEDGDGGADVNRSDVEWLLCVAVKLDGTRLIDNFVLK